MARLSIGSDFDQFLNEEGLLDEATAVAVKRYIAFQQSGDQNLGATDEMKTARSTQ